MTDKRGLKRGAFGLLGCVLGAVFVFMILDFSIDNRPAPSYTYKSMMKWMVKPIQHGGQDYTPLIPKILEAMVDDVILLREWKEILEAKEKIDLEHARLMLRRVISNG